MISSHFSLVIGLIILAQGLAKAPGRLPPVLGWNTWCTQNECGDDWCSADEILSVANSMKENGMLDAGYEYLNLDDCWGVRNAKTGHIEADPVRFPLGIKHVVDEAHRLGFKVGVYTDQGVNGCHHPFTGSWPYYHQDAKDFASWGIDYVKFDYCDPPDGFLPANLTANMSNALRSTGRSIWLNFHCNWLTFEDARCGLYGNSFRIAPDHIDAWYSTLKTSRALMQRKKWWGATGIPGLGYPDPDFVFTGGQGCGKHTINPPGVRCPGQTNEEYRSEFALNAIASGQILFASDPRNMSTIQKEILLNDEVLAIFKDQLGLNRVTQVVEQNHVKPSSNFCNVTLTKQLSHGSCSEGVDYGCYYGKTGNSNQYAIWVANGCRALFSCYGTKNVNCESAGEQYPDRSNVTCSCNPPSTQIWVRPLEGDSDIAVLLFNAGDGKENITFKFDEHVPPQAQFGGVRGVRSGIVRDVWKKKNLGIFEHNYTAHNVMPHASIFLKVKLF